jgi:hypothetical protein
MRSKRYLPLNSPPKILHVVLNFYTDGRGSKPGRGIFFIFSIASKTGSEAHSASYPMDTAGFFPGDKTTGT